jgi:hypothetical protein
MSGSQRRRETVCYSVRIPPDESGQFQAFLDSREITAQQALHQCVRSILGLPVVVTAAQAAGGGVAHAPASRAGRGGYA